MASAHRPDPGRAAHRRLDLPAPAARRRSASTTARRAVRLPARLGVTHVYLSPVLQAAPGSTHGYDVRRPRPHLSAELGGARGLRAGSSRPRASTGLGVVVDVVPNHMAVPDAGLRSTRPVVGAARRAAARRTPTGSTSTGRPRSGAILMPVLGGRIGEALERGDAPRSTTAARPARAGAALLRPRVPGARRAPRRCRWPSCVDRAVLPAGALAGRRRGAQLPALLRHRHAGRGPGRGPRGLRRPPTPLLLALHRRRRASTGCGSTTPTGWPTPRGYLAPAADAHRRRVGRRREDPRGRRAAARPTGRAPAPPGTTRCCGSSGLLRRPGRAPSALDRAVRRDAGARPGRARRRGRRGQALGRRARAGRRGAPAGRLAAATCCDVDLALRHPRGLREALVELLVAFDRLPRLRRAGRAWHPEQRRRGRRARPTGPAAAWPERRTTTLDVVVDLVLGRELAATRVDGGAAGRRVRRAVPADLRAGDGQGRRGHRVLPLAPARRAQRGRRRPRPPVGVGPRSSTPGAAPLQRRLADVDDHAVDPRHEARPRTCGPGSCVLSEAPEGWAALARGRRASGRRRTARRCSTAAPSTSLWQTLVGDLADRPRRAWRRTSRRRPARPSCTRRGPTPTRPTRTRCAAFADGALPRPGACTRDLDRRGQRRTSRRCARTCSARSWSQLTMPGRARRLPGLRARRPLAGRPRQPPPGRLRPTAARGWPGSTPASRPADLADEKLLVASRALRLRRDRPECSWARADVRRRAHLDRARARLRARRRAAPRRRRPWPPGPRGCSRGRRRLRRRHGRAARGHWRDVLDRRRGRRRRRRVRLADLLADLPVAAGEAVVTPCERESSSLGTRSRSRASSSGAPARRRPLVARG